MSKRIDDGISGLAQGLLDAISTMKQLAVQLHDNASVLGHLEQRAIALEADVSKLYTIMFEGDGKPSVTAQFMLISVELEALKVDRDRWRETEEARQLERRRTWTAILAAIITAATAVGIALLRK